MWIFTVLFGLGSILSVYSSIWSCTQDSDCLFTQGSVCVSGSCLCPAGHQLVLGGTACARWSPYYSSPCFEDFQCSRLVTNYKCRRNQSDQEGQCFCQKGSHYLFGRCWLSSDYGQACTVDEDCMGALRDPFSLVCDGNSGVCDCAPGYYRRQRGECRRIGNAVGEECVLDEDCQFTNGACDLLTFRCVDGSRAYKGRKTQRKTGKMNQIMTTAPSIYENVEQPNEQPITQQLNGFALNRYKIDGAASRRVGTSCDTSNDCGLPFVCTNLGLCACPQGYYSIEGHDLCYAELGSPSAEEECVGLLAEVKHGLCTCPANFYYNENMRDCVKVVRTITDSCISDESCHTFGAAVRCGEPTEPWQLRSCECIPELAVWDEERSMCRLFSGIGEPCQVGSDCLAGNLEIECVKTEGEEQGVCTCPEGTSQQDGLCLTAGLDLGESCQVSQECSATANAGCYNGVCACNASYVEQTGDCIPSLGATCAVDSDCKGMENLVCNYNQQTGSSTCQCDSLLVEADGRCWEPINNVDSVCNVTVQCTAVMGEFSACRDGRCECADNAHFRDERCWPRIGLFAPCSRTSECYLQNISERVVCRNSICQCSFDYPYSEELNTCIGTSSASSAVGSLTTILLLLYFAITH